ncbi:cytochrome b [Pelagerythrobacter sp.]|uniref:cytochrome b n=1 Tax=Pelagerythrobacter sp. TaxID=2800702 RepID=UPI0035B1DA01
MPLNDTKIRYGTVTRLLHWGIAALLAWQLGGMLAKEIVGRTPLTGFWVGSHVSIGSLLFVLILVRAVWALSQRKARPDHPGVVGALAKVGHFALYALMVIVPSLAVLRLFGSEDPVSVFGVQLRGATGGEIEWMTAPANFAHSTLAWLLLALIVGHVAMVAIHRFWWRDDTLARMAGDPRA